MKTLTILDIDGTIIPDMSIDILNNNINAIKCVKIQPKIIKFIHNISEETDFAFITGRPYKLRSITIEMLKCLNIKYKISFYKYQKWNVPEYIKYKLNVVKILSKDYDMIIMIDDILDVLENIKQNIKDKLLFLAYAKFNSVINDIQCLKILTKGE